MKIRLAILIHVRLDWFQHLRSLLVEVVYHQIDLTPPNRVCAGTHYRPFLERSLRRHSSFDKGVEHQDHTHQGNECDQRACEHLLLLRWYFQFHGTVRKKQTLINVHDTPNLWVIVSNYAVRQKQYPSICGECLISRTGFWAMAIVSSKYIKLHLKVRWHIASYPQGWQWTSQPRVFAFVSQFAWAVAAITILSTWFQIWPPVVRGWVKR